MSLRMVSVTAILAVAVLMPGTLLAQSGSGVITGIAKDATSGAIPGAQVKVVNEETRVSVESVTNQEGVYRVGALVPGTYRVEVELSETLYNVSIAPRPDRNGRRWCLR